QGAERPHQEAGGIGGEGREEGRGVVPLGKEEGGEERGPGGVEIKVVPLEYRAQRGGEDDFSLLLGRNLKDGRVGGRSRNAHGNPPLGSVGSELEDLGLLLVFGQLPRAVA